MARGGQPGYQGGMAPVRRGAAATMTTAPTTARVAPTRSATPQIVLLDSSGSKVREWIGVVA